MSVSKCKELLFCFFEFSRKWADMDEECWCAGVAIIYGMNWPQPSSTFLGYKWSSQINDQIHRRNKKKLN